MLVTLLAACGLPRACGWPCRAGFSETARIAYLAPLGRLRCIFAALIRPQNLNFVCFIPPRVADASKMKMIARLLRTSVARLIAPTFLAAALFILMASPLGFSEAWGFECGVSPVGGQRCGCIGETDCEAMIASGRCKPGPFCIASQFGTRVCGCEAFAEGAPSKVDDTSSH